MRNMTTGGTFRTILPEEVSRAHEMEALGFAPSEAASYEKMQWRQKVAPQLFLGYFEDNVMYGYIMSTAIHEDHLTQESMEFTHHPDGKTVCVHSVCVDKSKQKQGIAVRMLQHYTEHVQKADPIRCKLSLASRPNLIPLYTKGGYTYVGKSQIVHGPDPWYTMERFLV